MTGALAPLVRPLPVSRVRTDGGVVAELDDGTRLTICAMADRERMIAAVARPGRAPMTVSRSRAGGRYAMIAGRAGRIGLDMETVARVALNATAEDRWLASAERASVEEASDPASELACHWVLKEAYGKALGVGLALPFDLLVFGVLGGTVALGGDAAPDRGECWSFGLYRYADLLLGVACRWAGPNRRGRDGQAAIPFAPVGRKPPTPPRDR